MIFHRFGIDSSSMVLLYKVAQEKGRTPANDFSGRFGKERSNTLILSTIYIATNRKPNFSANKEHRLDSFFISFNFQYNSNKAYN